MKSRLLVLLLCFSFVSALVAQVPPYQRHWLKEAYQLRVMSYNICEGFICGQGAEPERQRDLVEWVKSQDPEILALQELVGFNAKKLAELAKQWGHPYSAIVKENGYPVGITSKRPIEVKNRIVENIGHGLLHVKTYGLDIIVTHLNPGSTEKRRVEAHNILEYVEKNQLTSFMLMGDMNAHSPLDAPYYDKYAVNLLRSYGGDKSPNLLNGNIDYSVISTFMSHPLIDLCGQFVDPDCRVSFPTPLNMTQSKNNYFIKKRQERIDFIFATPDLAKKAVDAFVWNQEPTYYLSDHFPIGVDLLLTGK